MSTFCQPMVEPTWLCILRVQTEPNPIMSLQSSAFTARARATNTGCVRKPVLKMNAVTGCITDRYARDRSVIVHPVAVTLKDKAAA
jgi:hypothetical protein